MDTTKIIVQLKRSLPAVFGRSSIDQLFPGIIKSKTQANIDSAGNGPPSYKHGRNVFYEKDSYLEWLSKRITTNISVE